MSKKDYSDICSQVITVCREAQSFIEKHRYKIQSSDIETKSLNSLVSFVDKGAEEILVKGLKLILPEAGFIAEEETETQRGDRFNWIVDPLDGTTNFLHGLPVFAISVALAEQDEIKVGVIIEIGQNECFHAWENGGSFLNDQPIFVNKTSNLSDTLIATGFPYYNFERTDEFFAILKSFMHKTRGVRRMGSAATDLAYVACGRFDAFFEYGLNPWDVAAGVLLVKEAGGKVSDYKGGDKYLFGDEIAASSSEIYTLFMEVLQNS